MWFWCDDLRWCLPAVGSKKLGALADAAEKLNAQKGLAVEMLADLTHQTKKKALKKLRGYIHKAG